MRTAQAIEQRHRIVINPVSCQQKAKVENKRCRIGRVIFRVFKRFLEFSKDELLLIFFAN